MANHDLHTKYVFNDWYNNVKDFMKAVGQDAPPKPALPSAQVIARRGRMLKEECREYLKAAFAGDLVGTADAIADIIYVALGAAVEAGIDIRPIWRVVHDCNMKKIDGPKRADGKQLKPEGWVGPERWIADLLDV